MQYGTVNGCKISRLGLGTKRFPTEDSSRVVHLDVKTASAIFQAAIDGGVDFFDTSYSNHKGEAESFLGDEFAKVAKPLHVCTSFFEMVDPRYEYVFQKQLKKLGKECIDFYAIEGVTDINKEVNVESGAIDYFFERKEAGQIAQIGFNSELSPDELAKFLKRYPWDFVRMRINFFDWFEGRTREAYEIASEAGVPILAHGALRVGPASLLKEDALAVLRPGWRAQVECRMGAHVREIPRKRAQRVMQRSFGRADRIQYCRVRGRCGALRFRDGDVEGSCACPKGCLRSSQLGTWGLPRTGFPS